MLYSIPVGRTATRVLNVEVEANTEEEAQESAIEIASDQDFALGVEIDDVSYDLV